MRKITSENLLEVLRVRHPIFLAPMAGVATPALAAEVTNAGGLGGLGVGNLSPAQARAQIEATKDLLKTNRMFQANVFCHKTTVRDAGKEEQWRNYLSPQFAALRAHAPTATQLLYKSFIDDGDEMLHTLIETRTPVVSFHFGLPNQAQLRKLRGAGVITMATATSPDEAQLVHDAGIDVIVAQGVSAGGHRGVFDENVEPNIDTSDLVRGICGLGLTTPVVAAGGLMCGGDVAKVLRLGATAAQLGTAFICCPSSSASPHHRALLTKGDAETVITAALSGRPARCIANEWASISSTKSMPDYPLPYDAAKALQDYGKGNGTNAFAIMFAGQGAKSARAMDAQKLVDCLVEEMGSN